ncbi:MAG: ABC transporter permease [Spirochaetia bacterium]|nr:ABC transporter permease [Spirochaetia bacterium]
MKYAVKRILWMIPTFIGIITITFFLTKLRPDPISQKLLNPDGIKDTSASEQYVEQLKKYYGYDKPLLTQYFIMWKNILKLDFSTSRIDHRPVIDKIKESLPVTLGLNIITILIVYIISIPLGIYSAINGDSRFDKGLTLFLYVLYSLPTFWVALLLLKYLSGGDYLDIFPLNGLKSDYFDELNWLQKLMDFGWHLFLPVVVSVYGSFAFLSRFVKNSFMEALKSDYIRTARAKGLTERRVIYVHAMKNSMIPIITMMAGLLPGLFGGSVIIESIFSLPGMGKLAYDSIYSNDETVIIAAVAFSALLTLFGILISDLTYAMVDPRIDLEKENSR